jgi:hypothetical protein
LGFETLHCHPKSHKNKVLLQDGNGQLELKLLLNLTDSAKAVTDTQNQRQYKSHLQDGNGQEVWASGLCADTRGATRTSCLCRTATGDYRKLRSLNFGECTVSVIQKAYSPQNDSLSIVQNSN